MRCKNCGTDNDENRYICANCGSPLYDEDNFANTESIPNQTDSNNQAQIDNRHNVQGQNEHNTGGNNNGNSEKKSIIVIAILVVVLIAIITSVIVVANTRKRNDEETTQELTTVTTTEVQTTKETTTKETTTKETTQATTAKVTCNVRLFSKGGGTVICSKSGTPSSSYDKGDNVTIIATPDADYTFDGWYSDGNCISTSPTYSFTITDNMNISAQFSLVQTTTTQIDDTTSENIEVNE